MLKPGYLHLHRKSRRQPPSGGCVLKQPFAQVVVTWIFQPPSGGCVLKLRLICIGRTRFYQPPSGGCVLKLYGQVYIGGQNDPAAFRRLCVETLALKPAFGAINLPAAFRRLCVETSVLPCSAASTTQPPSGGCVLKHDLISRATSTLPQPPSGGCVLKRR